MRTRSVQMVIQPMRESFGLTSDGSGLDFQVEADAADLINVNFGNASISSLFAGTRHSKRSAGFNEIGVMW